MPMQRKRAGLASEAGSRNRPLFEAAPSYGGFGFVVSVELVPPLVPVFFTDDESPQPMAVTTSAPARRSNAINLFTARPSFPEGAKTKIPGAHMTGLLTHASLSPYRNSTVICRDS